MKSSCISLLCVVCGMLFAALLPHPAHSTQLNINANECQPFNAEASAQDFERSETGIRAMTTTLPTDVQNREVTCALPLLATAGSSVRIWVDAGITNPGIGHGGWMTCDVYSVREDGGFIGSIGFGSSGPAVHVAIDLPPGWMDPRGQLAVICMLPAQGTGTLRGFTTLASPLY